jgi:hypothetical protein
MRAKLAVSRDPKRECKAASARSPALAGEREPVTSLQFGDETVYYGAEAEWGRFAGSAARAGLVLHERAEPIDTTRLHVVIQKGRLFQREHRDVAVLLDKGRFLLVDMDPKEAQQLARRIQPCFSVRPLDALETLVNSARTAWSLRPAAGVRIELPPAPLTQRCRRS